MTARRLRPKTADELEDEIIVAAIRSGRTDAEIAAMEELAGAPNRAARIREKRQAIDAGCEHRELPAAASDQKSRPEYLAWPSLATRTPPARKWLMADWLTAGPTLFSGRGGVGKTTTAQAMATALASQVDYIAKVERPLISLMWACEDDHNELWRRQVQICNALDVEMPSLEGMFYLESRMGCDNSLYAPLLGRMQWTETFERLREQVNDTRADILWLDNIGQTFAGNENERHPVTAYVNGLMGLRPGIAVVLLGHPARSSGSEFAGSAAWENAVRSRWYFGDRLPDQCDEEESPDEDVRYLCRRKANYTFRDYIKLRFRDGVFMPAREPAADSFAERYGGQNRQEAIDSLLLAGFDKCIAAGIHPTDGPSSPDYLPRKLVEMKLGGDYSKKDLVSAMHRLVGDGRLKRGQIGTYSNRNPKFGLLKP